jgi:hypothetical protein
MLQQLAAAANAGTIKITHVYLGHIKKDDERKVLAHAEAYEWEGVEPSIRGVLEQHLYQAIDGSLGQENFPCMFHGEVLTVAKVASEEYDRSRNRPTVEVMEAIRNFKPDPHVAIGALNPIIDLGNNLAYKIMSAGAIKNHLVAILKFSVVPQLGAAAIPFVFTTLVDLDDRQESLFDERSGKFVVTDLHNIIKRAKVARAAFFPCLGDDGEETADLLVYAGSGAGAWFKALEMTPRLSPKQEGRALIRMIAEQTAGEDVRPDLFQVMYTHLEDLKVDGIHVFRVIAALENAVGHGVDGYGFQARWESAFGDLGYRPAFASLFGGADNDPPELKIMADDIKVKLSTAQLTQVRQVSMGDTSFLVVALPRSAKIAVGQDLDMRLQPMTEDEARAWMAERSSPVPTPPHGKRHVATP